MQLNIFNVEIASNYSKRRAFFRMPILCVAYRVETSTGTEYALEWPELGLSTIGYVRLKYAIDNMKDLIEAKWIQVDDDMSNNENEWMIMNRYIEDCPLREDEDQIQMRIKDDENRKKMQELKARLLAKQEAENAN